MATLLEGGHAQNALPQTAQATVNCRILPSHDPADVQARLLALAEPFEVGFVTKDTRTKQMVETTYTPAAFLATLADHVPDRYRHNIRYFGLLAPRVKCQTHDAVFALLGQERLGKPRRLWWAASMKRSFGVDPLLDREANQMRWTRRLPPAPPR